MGTPVRVALQKSAYCLLLFCPSLLVAPAKELVIFGGPNGTAKPRLSRGMLEFSDTVPEVRPVDAVFVLKNPFDRCMGARTSLPRTLAENLVNLLGSEESK